LELSQNSSTIDSIGTILALIYVFGGLVSQIYRYYRISNAEERQQTKWVVFALGIFIVLLVAGEITPVLLHRLSWDPCRLLGSIFR